MLRLPVFITSTLIACAGASGESPSFSDVTEADFPFYGTVVDARKAGVHPVPDNLVPRGIILKIGGDHYACFDPDLLRIALVWKGSPEGFLTMKAMGPGSYKIPSKKAPPGQKALPLPLGEILLATGTSPGWTTESPTLEDPRPSAISPEEVGRGPLDPVKGRWESLEIHEKRPYLAYTLGKSRVRETLRHHEGGRIQRDLQISAGDESLFAHLASYPEPPVLKSERSARPAKPGQGPHVSLPSGFFPTALVVHENSLFLKVPARQGLAQIRVTISSEEIKASTAGGAPMHFPDLLPSKPAPRRWKETVASPIKLGFEDRGSLVIDDIALPLPNPWKRNVRIADIAFIDEQRAAVVTFDGDIWIASGIGGWSAEARWSRFASGLHEPKSIEALDGVLYVFDRTGILRVLDIDGNGEADRYENFCNLFTQTAETREFAMGMKLHPEGGFVIAKGGQSASTLTKERGSILHVAADGKSYEVLATGLRQPYPGVDSLTGTVTASDQQGHFTPTTPIHFFDTGKAEHHGFLPSAHPTKKQNPQVPVAEPPLWIPHPINQSGSTQVWLRGSRLGPLEGSLLHLGYNKPDVFRIHRDSREGLRQGAAVEVLGDLPGSILNGKVNPRDGWLYLTGFQIWGGISDRISALYRVRPGKKPRPLLIEAFAGERGILLRFDTALAPDSVTRSNLHAERWNYQRTASYGSPHFKTDGEPGQDFVPIASTQLSKDGKSLFIGIPDMKPVQTFHLSLSVQTKEGAALNRSAYLTIHKNPAIKLPDYGFDSNEVDLEVPPEAGKPGDAPAPTAVEGKRLVTLFGCVACHSTDGKQEQRIGPTWKGLHGSTRTLVDGSKAEADEAYLRESILKPQAKITKGYNKAGTGMPSYLGILRDDQIDSVLLYLETLAKPAR